MRHPYSPRPEQVFEAIYLDVLTRSISAEDQRSSSMRLRYHVATCLSKNAPCSLEELGKLHNVWTVRGNDCGRGVLADSFAWSPRSGLCVATPKSVLC